MTPEELAAFLKAERIKQNMPQRELARRMQAAQGTICDLENGVIKRPRLVTVLRWAKALGVKELILTTE
jgi:transcriptional regulator with XRE-family HTH domain